MNSPDLSAIKAYFSRRFEEHGTSPNGVDWNSPAAQFIRFDQLLRVIDQTEFSLLDFGCGYGAFAGYLDQVGLQCTYYGYDIVEGSVAAARQTYAGQPRKTFITDPAALPEVDYTVASGVFNIRGAPSPEAWHAYILETLHQFNRLSRRGFASNFLTRYSDPERMRPGLYYADPLDLFDYCKRNFSKKVALLHDYPLYDFTLIVRKE